MSAPSASPLREPVPGRPEARLRAELAAAFRWAARMNWHEAVANHFSLAVDEGGRRFLMNPGGSHFALIRASDLLLLDADDPAARERDGAPDPTAWSLHGALHRAWPHARCALHVHPTYSTVLATLADPTLPPIDQNTAAFWNRVALDPDYGGLALGEEAERAVRHLSDPSRRVLLMAHHGVMVVGDDVADALTRLYYFERAAETYLKALWTGRPLRVLPPATAERVARQSEAYGDFADRHLAAVMALLDRDGEDFRD
jgi:ribulose-5-phosphate 4-epimerase/fuculose-1-phosphate aldolase